MPLFLTILCLSFQKYLFSTYNVQSIQVSTCMNAPMQAGACS